MKARSIAAGLVTVVAAATIPAVPAVAGESVDLCTQLRASLMTNADIPNWLSTTKQRSTRCKTPAVQSDRPLACFEDGGADIWGLKPKARAHAEIKLGGDETTGAALEAGNTIYAYPTLKRAHKAWKDFERKARACPADATIVRGDAVETVTIRQTTAFSTIGKFHGHKGFALTNRVWIDGTGINTFHADANKYTAFRLVGKTIERVYLNNSTQVAADISLSTKQKTWIRKETKVVGHRILSQSLLK